MGFVGWVERSETHHRPRRQERPMMGFARAQPIPGTRSLRSRPQTDPPRSLAGIGWMLLGIAIFSVNDALGKWLLLDYSVGELLLIRSAAALVVLIPFLRNAGVEAFVTAP